MYEVVFFEKENDTVPAQEFLDGLSIKLREKTLRSLMLLQELGPELRGEETEYIRDGLFKLRTKFGSDITRVFYFFFAGKRIVCDGRLCKEESEDVTT